MIKTIAVVAISAATLYAAPALADPTPNVIRGTAQADTLVGTHKNDLIIGRRGDDNLFGDRGKDFLGGGRGNDTLRGAGHRSGRDVLRGGSGRDRCIGNAAAPGQKADVFLSCEIIVRR